MSQTVELAGHPFAIYPIGTGFKAVPGVYAFLAQGVGSLNVLYVGEAENLNDRLFTSLESHHRCDCAVTRGGATHLAVRAVSGGKLARTSLESEIRQAHNPPCNRQ